MNLLPFGPRAVLAEFDGLDEVIAAADAWRAAAWPGVVDIVPAARTVLVVHDGRFDLGLLTAVATGPRPVPEEHVPVDVPVRYDGEDLAAVAAAVGLSVEEVVHRHTAPDYTAAFCGFMPGFAYLVGLDPVLTLPRRATPRTRVPAGAVAIAANFSAVYPSASPGGWQLLGTTNTPMWDDHRDVPATVQPGSHVRFVAVRELPDITPARADADAAAPDVVLTEVGLHGRVVGAGRPGRAWLGASRGGAVDLDAHALGNRIVGNATDAFAIETSGGTAVHLRRAALVAVTGALADITVTGGPPLGWGAPIVLPAGATIRVGRVRDGLRVYLAVRGGLRATDGGWALGDDPLTAAATHAVPRRALRPTIGVWPGPRSNWFEAGEMDRMCAAEYTVTDSSAVGLRLDGPLLRRLVTDELPSEGLVEGAIQVPPDGRPIVMLADHPTTGGYPVIGVVDPADLATVAQAAPGTNIRFVRAR